MEYPTPKKEERKYQASQPSDNKPPKNLNPPSRNMIPPTRNGYQNNNKNDKVEVINMGYNEHEDLPLNNGEGNKQFMEMEEEEE